MLWTIVLGGILVFFIWECLRPNYPSEQNKPGKFHYTKKWLFYLLFVLNSRGKHLKQSGLEPDRTKRGYGQTLTDPVLLDGCQTLEDDPNAIDTAYFNGFDSDGTSLALRIARKHGREAELWVLLDIPGVGFFQHPLHPDTAVYNTGDGMFSAAGCKFQVLEPMRRWKVTFNGLLRKGICNEFENKPEEYAHVAMTFNWECMNDPFNFDVDLDKSLLADAIAKQNWTREFWDHLKKKHQTHYEQVGELSGKIEIEGHPERRVHLKGIRDHTFGVRNWEMFHRYAAHFIWVEETGMMVFMIVLWMPGYITFLKTGYLVYASGETFPITDTDLDIVSITKNKTPPANYNFSFHAGGERYNVEVKIHTIPELYHYSSRSSRILETLTTFTVNGRFARGITEFHYRNQDGPEMKGPEMKSVPLLVEPPFVEGEVESGEITLVFQESLCRSSKLVGGKGSQLALLTSIQDKISAKVPRGFCLTLAAFQAQLKNNCVIGEKIGQISKAARQNDHTNMKVFCDDVVHLLATSKIVQPIEEKIMKALNSIFGDLDKVPLAVRSSAAGEDGSEASSAGQMETFLGVQGASDVLEAIQKCWASAYTYQAVEYRRQHGQMVKTLVGVVLQEMVPSEVAGVLFTHDPLTGNPNKMVLDASYGLGEIVVSGKSTPDTIIVQRHFDDKIKIQEKKLGDKELTINLSDLSTGGTIEKKTDRSLSQQCCLSDEQISKLCGVAIEVEKYFGGGRDIEWSIHGNCIYLLQARPITTDEQETDEDFIHEFDSPVITGKEMHTIGNIGEMMPGAVTPLTSSTFVRAVDRATSNTVTQLSGGRLKQFADNKTVPQYSGHAFINMTYLAQKVNNSMIGKKNALELNLLGETFPNHKLEDIVLHGKLKTNRLTQLMDFLNFLSYQKQQIKQANSWVERVKTYNIGLDCRTATDLYRDIEKYLPDYFEMWKNTVIKSGESGNSNAFMMGIISGGKDVWTIDNYTDVSNLLSQCHNVYSAEVPAAIQGLAKTIENHSLTEEFLKMSDKECVAYFSSEDCNTELKKQYTLFLERHGHRCIREAELTERSWRSEPEKFIKILKSVLSSKAFNMEIPSLPDLTEVINNLRSPVSAFGKFLIKKLAPRAREGVIQRELGKSVAVHVSDKFKEAYWRLADMMVKEERLTDGELMFFLTHTEVGQLLETRSAKLITRAIRRRKVLPLQSKLEFPRICLGRPQPITNDSEDSKEVRKSSSLTGTPVCRGSVRGTARVVKCLEDASSIQKGDILIVCYTDIGWTPYFPLISGLVTEMGGLISHGAVVAREYGIPCLVNVSKATKQLNTGDSIHLDANSGVIHKLEEDPASATIEDMAENSGYISKKEAT